MSIEIKTIQENVDKVFIDAFGNTSLKKRLEDIEGDARELCQFTDLKNLKEQYKSLGRKTNVAILGGAFNPITKAHIEVAKLVLNASKWADEVWLMPTNKHIKGKNTIPFEDRFKICELAAQADGRIKVCDYEYKHNLKVETYHLLNKMIHDKELDNYRFGYFIALDNANTMDTWYNSAEVIKIDFKFIVVPRKGVKRDPNVTWYFQKPHQYIVDECKYKYEISSTILRNIIANGDMLKINKYIDSNVWNYIYDKKLYKI
jgi:nicotinate (nicotinamide) nucleotide adenylyltransferase